MVPNGSDESYVDKMHDLYDGEVESYGSHSAQLATAVSAQSPLTARHRVLLLR